jgi:ribosomal-protein-alanine N-acetyltransferase
VFAIRAMTEADANAVAGWRYPGEYAFYDWTQDPGDLAELLDPSEWGRRYFAVDADGRLAGFVVFQLQGEVADIGLGLRPDLTGEGHGAAFVEAGLRFAVARFGARRFTLAVAAFNRRAITVYERAGFVETERYRHHTNGADHDFVAMERGPV